MNTRTTRTLFKGASIAFAGNLILQALLFVYQVPLIRLLGPDKYGVLGIINTVVTLAGELALFGLGNGIMYYLSRAYEPFSKQDVKGIVTSASKIVLTASIAALLLVAAFAGFLVERLYPFPNIRALLFLGSLGIPLTAFWNMGQAVFRAVGKAEFVYKPRVVSSVLQVLLIPLLVWLSDGNLFLVVAANLLISAIPIVYGLRLLDRNILPLKQLVRPPRSSYTQQLLQFSWPLLVSAYFWNIGNRLDVLLIGYFLDEHQVGIYRPALALSATLWLVPMALTYLLFPMISSLRGREDEGQFLSISERTFKYIMYANLPLVCFFVVFSESLMTALFGAEFSSGAGALGILSVAILFQSFYTVPNYIIQAQEKTKMSMWILIVTMSINVVGMCVLTPVYGIEGTALAVAASYLVAMLLAMISSAQLIDRFMFPYRAIGILCIGALVILVSFVYRDRTLGEDLIIYGVFIMGWLLWLIFFERREIDSLQKLAVTAFDRLRKG